MTKLYKSIISFLFLVSFVISSTASYAEIVGRLSVHWSPKHHSAKHAQIFADEVNKRAKGKLKIEVYPSKQLFGIREVMGAVTSGAVELGGIVGVVSFPPINKNFNVASFPGLFNSWEQQRGFFQNSSKGKEIWGDLTKKTNSTLIMPGVISGALFAFVTSFDEVVVVLFLAGLENTTIPIQMWTGLREQLSPTILAVATCLIVLSVLILVTAELLRRRSERLRGINR